MVDVFAGRHLDQILVLIVKTRVQPSSRLIRYSGDLTAAAAQPRSRIGREKVRHPRVLLDRAAQPQSSFLFLSFTMLESVRYPFGVSGSTGSPAAWSNHESNLQGTDFSRADRP